MSIPLQWDEIPWLDYIFARDLYERQVNQGGQKFVWTQVNLRYPGIPRISQFLLAFYPRL